uniref:Uncharacterized protein n=1 Tax=viral metagenome TaxID=1070528 RepID=A0A6M3IVW1_9ZZZZ
MAVRTTSTLVSAIIEVDTVSVSDLSPFIAAASAMVDQACSTDDYTADQLTQIETWLSAHIYTVRDPRAETEKAGSVSVKYQSKVALNLASSHYGQTAMLLDYMGGLAALSKRIENGKAKSVSVTWWGDEDT